MLAGNLQVLVRDDRHDHRRRHEDPVIKDAESVDRDRPVKSHNFREPVLRQVRLLPPQPETGEPFRQHDEQQQPFSLPQVAEDEEIEEQNSAPKQRQHQRRNDRKVIGGRIKLAHCAPCSVSRSLGAPALARSIWRAAPRPWSLAVSSWLLSGRTRCTISATGCRSTSKYGFGYSPIQNAHAI